MGDGDELVEPPARLRQLTSWQANKVSTLGARLFARHMPLGARADFAVLAALEDHESLSQAQIGRLLGLDRNDVNGILNRLEAGHQVSRRPDPADRRRNVVGITGGGRDYLAQLQAYTDAVHDELLAALDATERQQLHMLLAKLLSGHKPQTA
jgi:DNA-binding MarR family transcriptional regulator